MGWTIETKDGKVIFWPGMTIPDLGVVSLEIAPQEAIDIGEAMASAGVHLREEEKRISNAPTKMGTVNSPGQLKSGGKVIDAPNS